MLDLGHRSGSLEALWKIFLPLTPFFMEREHYGDKRCSMVVGFCSSDGEDVTATSESKFLMRDIV